MVRWSREPRSIPVGEESRAASLSRLRVTCSRVIVNDDTIITEASQYISSKKCSHLTDPVIQGDLTDPPPDERSVRSGKQPRTAPMITTELRCGILSGKVGSTIRHRR